MCKSSGVRSIPGLYIVLTAGIMILYVSSLVQANPILNFTDPTEANASIISRNWTIINITISEPMLDSFILNWLGNNTTYTNLSPEITSINSSLYVFYKNRTDITNGNYTYYAWSNDTSGNFGYTLEYNDTHPRTLTIDTIIPSFSSYQRSPITPTEEEGVQVNSTITDTNLAAVTLEWNNSVNYTVSTHTGNEYYFTIEKSNYTAHDNITYYWYANDTAGNLNRSDQQSFTVSNQVPTVTSPTISNTTPRTNDILNCTGGIFSDSDNEDTEVSRYYLWFDTGVLVSGQTGQNISLSVSGMDKNDNITCSVKVYDGYDNSTWVNSSNSALIQNSPPAIPSSINITSTVLVGNNLNANASGSNDADNDAITYYYQFYNLNDSVIRQAWSLNNNYSLQQIDAHDVIRVYALATDTTSDSTNFTSDRNVSDTSPTNPSGSSLTSGMIKAGDSLTASANGSTDADNDTITYYYQFYNLNDSLVIQPNSTNNTYRVNRSDEYDKIRVRIWASTLYGDSSGYEEFNNSITDSTSPQITINSPQPNSRLASRTISVNLTVAEINLNYTNISISNSTGSIANSTSDSTNGTLIINLSVPYDGVFSINATSYDIYQNLNSTASVNITIDTQPPALLQISLSDPTPTKSGNVTFTLDFSEGMNQSVNTTIQIKNTSTYDITPLGWLNSTRWLGWYNFTTLTGDENYTINVTGAKDLAGNQMDENSSESFLLDTASPKINLTFPLNTTYGATSLILNFSATDRTSGIYSCWYNLDSGTNQTLSGCQNTSLNNLTNGTHTLALYSNDSAGNVNLSLANFTISLGFYINISEPSDEAQYNRSTLSFNFTTIGTESNYSCNLYINGTAYGINSSVMNNTLTTITSNHSLVNGTYAWFVNCTGLHGNNHSASRQITIDTIFPTINFTCSFSSLRRGEEQICECSSTDNFTPDEEISLVYPGSPSTQTAGSRTVSCTATDFAGNSNTTSFNYTVTDVASGGGGGGGGGLTLADKIRFETDDSDIAIEVYFNDTLAAPSIKVKKVASLNVIDPPGFIYQLLNITKTNFENGNINNSTITFRVSMAWIEENNITSVYMAHYNGTGWINLRTEQLEIRGNNVYFITYPDSFSYYAIIGVNNTCPEAQKRCAQNGIEVCQNNGWEQVTACPNGCNQTSRECNALQENQTNEPCLDGEKRCNFDTLEECRTGNWTYIEICEKGCNSSANACTFNEYSKEAKSAGSPLYLIIGFGAIALAAAGTFILNKYGKLKPLIHKKGAYAESSSEKIDVEITKIENKLNAQLVLDEALKLDKEDRRDVDSS